MDLATELIALWTARRTRLLHNEKVNAAEGSYERAIVAKAEAKATLDAIEDVSRVHLAVEAMRMAKARQDVDVAAPIVKAPLNFYPSNRHV